MLAWIDQIIYLLYFIVVGGYGYYIYRRKHSSGSLTHDYFLAEGSLSWWAIGASIIASNISAEQFIGMSVRVSHWDWPLHPMNGWLLSD